MVDEKKPAEPAKSSSAGIFGPVIHVIHEARKVHPAAGILLILLAIFIVVTVVYQQISPFAGDGWPDIVRFIVYAVLISLFLMMLVAFFAEFIMPSENPKQGAQFGRGAMLVLMIAAGGGGGWLANENCKFDRFVFGGEPCALAPLDDRDEEPTNKVAASDKDEVKAPDPEPKPIPAPPKPVVFGGYVNNRKTAEATIRNLRARVRFTTELFVADVTPDNIFTVELPPEAVDETVYVSIRGQGFRSISNKAVKIAKPLKGTENVNHIWDLFPISKPTQPPDLTHKVKIPSQYLRKLESKAIQLQKK